MRILKQVNVMMENFPEIPIFASFSGQPINFKVACLGPKKKHYINRIKKYGGVTVKSGGRPRIVLFGGGLPCQEGHSNCRLHPPFGAQPAFKIEWIDDCIESKELLDIRFYMLNPSPAFTRTDYMEKITEGHYAPPPREPSTVKPVDPERAPLNIDVNISGEEFSRHKEAVRAFLYPQQPQKNTPAYSSAVEQQEHSFRIESQPSSTPRVPQNQKKVPQLFPASSAPEPALGEVTPVVDLPESQETDVLLSPGIDLDLLAECCPWAIIPLNSGPPRSNSDSSSQDEVPPTRRSPELPARNVATDCPQSKTATDQYQVPPRNTTSERSGPSHPTERKRPEPVPAAAAQHDPNIESSSDSEPDACFRQGTRPQVVNKGALVAKKPAAVPPSPPTKRRFPTRAPYTRDEERAILHYIKSSGRLTGLRSNVMWREMEGQAGLERRSMQSLKNHFLKHLLPQLERYNIFTRSEIATIRSV